MYYYLFVDPGQSFDRKWVTNAQFVGEKVNEESILYFLRENIKITTAIFVFL